MSDQDDFEAKIFGLMAMAEDQQKALDSALAELKSQQTALSGVVQQFGGLGKQAVSQIQAASTDSARSETRAVVAEVLTSSAARLKEATRWLLAAAIILGVLSLIPVLSFWWERHELDALRAQRRELEADVAQMTENANKLEAKGGRVRWNSCEGRLCFAIAGKQASGVQAQGGWVGSGEQWIVPKGY